MTSDTDTGTLAAAIASEKRKLLTEGNVPDTLGSAGVVGVIALVEHAHTDARGLTAWVGGMALLLSMRLVIPRFLRHAGDARFLAWCPWFAVVFGMAWASSVLLVRPDDFAFECFVALSLSVVFTTGCIFHAHHPPMLYAFQLTGLGCLSIIYALHGGAIDWGIAAGFAALMWALIGFGRTFNRSFMRAIELAFENRKLVGELTDKTLALEQANVAKTRFLASASHDLRQPLHAMSLLVGVLAQRARGQGLDDVIGRIDKSAEAMESLLKAILDISRLDAGVERAQVEPLRVDALLARIERHFAPIAVAQGLGLRVRASSAWVLSDEAMLSRMLDNLVSNALRYTRRGGVLVAARARGDAIVFEVHDSGIGIDAARLDEIFEEFVQLHNPERDRAKGLGLGLSIVRRTARLLGHRVDVASTPGRGSVFRLSVPRAASFDTDDAPAPATPAGLDGLAVLVIDDEPPIRQALQELLQGWGCECEVAADGDAALALLARRPRRPDVILCDYRLAGADGVEVVARLRAALGARVPALIVTGDIAADRLVQIARSELPVMHKPVNPARLREWLAALAATADSGAGPAAPPPPPPASGSSPTACETALPDAS